MSSGVLADTSVWIPFFNGIESPQVEYLKQGIRGDQPLFLCPVIIQEILQGIRSEEEFEQVKDSILAFPIPDWNPVEASISAAQLYRGLRKKGVTIRKSNDCLIAAFAQQFDLAVLHVDRDFSLMAEQGVIRVVVFEKP
ncbi:MAG: PIN domain nuclease [Lewinellaceae bacterium]|nr:PIN domain nuclease [Lewinellaceae bacterium]